MAEMNQFQSGKKKSISKNSLPMKIFFVVINAFFLIYIIFPLLATLLFSISSKWTNTVFPETWSLDAYKTIFTHQDFYHVIGRTVFLASIVTFIELAITIMALLGIRIGGQKLEGLIVTLSIIPLALPGVVLALGTIKFYGIIAPFMLGKPALLIGAQTAFGLPFVYWTLLNAFKSLDVNGLYDASRTLKCSCLVFIIRILVPSLKRGIIIAGVTAFAAAFNSFALSQLLVGAAWETYPVYLYKYFKTDGHIASTLSIIFTIIIFIMSTAVAGFRNKPLSRLQKEENQ
jgi:putative spermidine/putrescine transport system permease protein